ncbi:hypothetical protein PQJ75_03350 [Rhodoplanes sp. TEM]|uniref:DUF2946 domain-containing protein n=1 Tax=Rhodoplanes tepidamans TaxID=200616 RepID=A0ABT5JI94_RHOTP|nr:MULTISPECIES: DUF2946 family protein [Rhodoplanes]MDC7789138.1 hypothetical protein [Rhodoplanes tepidamans]MDC7982755.1 hypothetical protein [Rhodoplanes sp. TEM]MDQ0357416.1 hypothetical protein [Rhodoplanes tepidamans]
MAAAVVVTVALLLQILLPALALPGRAGDPGALGWTVADAFCFGGPARPADGGDTGSGSDAPGSGAPAGTHASCVLCTTPGLAATVAPPDLAGLDWVWVVSAPPRLRPVSVAASERMPIRPRAPPAA